MAKEKQVWINSVHVGWATKAKVSPQTSTEETPTFDGVIIDGTDNISHNIDVDKLRYGTIQEYTEMDKILYSMLNTPATIKIIETVTLPEGKMKITDIVYNCTLTTEDYELDPTSRTVENLSFKGGKRKRWINGVQTR